MIARISAYMSTDSIAMVLIRTVSATFTAVRNRFAGRALLSMDERMLKDIGLTPDDVRSAYSQPVREDPTMVLRLKAVSARASYYEKARMSPPKVAPAPKHPEPKHPEEVQLDRCA